MANVETRTSEGFVEMIARMEAEGDHGMMTKADWDELKAKWMDVYTEIKNKEKNPMLLSWEDIRDLHN